MANDTRYISRLFFFTEFAPETQVGIFHRFVDEDSDETSRGLEEAFPDLSTNADWLNLLRTTYGALAWQIARQAKRSAEIVRQVI